MDNMDFNGLDEQLEQEEEQKENITPIDKPHPYVEWKVGDEAYKLKLTASAITRLERVLGAGLYEAILDEGIPSVTTTITTLQGALQKFHHGMKSEKVENLYDTYIDDGNTQIDLLRDVIYPLMYDAGFFTKAQMEAVQREMVEAESEL